LLHSAAKTGARRWQKPIAQKEKNCVISLMRKHHGRCLASMHLIVMVRSVGLRVCIRLLIVPAPEWMARFASRIPNLCGRKLVLFLFLFESKVLGHCPVLSNCHCTCLSSYVDPLQDRRFLMFLFDTSVEHMHFDLFLKNFRVSRQATICNLARTKRSIVSTDDVSERKFRRCEFLEVAVTDIFDELRFLLESVRSRHDHNESSSNLFKVAAAF
jgi:hypothetical protein